ncbi:hypothetical protein ADUPG1_013450 [Aduncisulcus paluster]|uniref:Uncharacterized protein n=1 Tax=Aduncisulcus paluster TaxID=2918883 RepID=A0ABQ5K733_9EUKA|nr:hypothetical protein ADUPG1_013450 [Aduncisulcus paluster]
MQIRAVQNLKPIFFPQYCILKYNGGQPGTMMTFSIQSLRDVLFLGAQPYFDSFMSSFQIPDFEEQFTFGLGKADVKFENFSINSYNFFPDEYVVIDSLPSVNGIFVEASHAAASVSLDYSIRLLTYPYSSLVGSASLSVGNMALEGSAVAGITPDTKDTTCCDQSYVNDDDSECVSCGYIPTMTINDLKIDISDIIITYIGDVDPILEMITDLIETALGPFLSTSLSKALMIFINHEDPSSYFGLLTPKPIRTSNKFYLGYAQNMIVGANYFVIQTYSVNVNGGNNLTREQHLWPDYDPPSLPYDMFSAEMSYTISLDSIESLFYNTLVYLNDDWNKSRATFDTIACVITRDGCYTKDGGPGGHSSSYVIQHNLGRSMDDPPSPLSPFFTTPYYEHSIPDLYSLCSNCYIDIMYTYNTIDNVPTVPTISMRLDGFDLVYSDMHIVIDIVDADTGDITTSLELSVDIATQGIVWSDHAYINFLQSVGSVSNGRLEICSAPSSPSSTSSSSSSCADIELSEWMSLVSIISNLYLDASFGQTFRQQYYGFNYQTRLPLAYFHTCVSDDEETWYNPDDSYVVVSFNLVACACNEFLFDDQSRDDNGEVYCIPQDI